MTHNWRVHYCKKRSAISAFPHHSGPTLQQSPEFQESTWDATEHKFFGGKSGFAHKLAFHVVNGWFSQGKRNYSSETLNARKIASSTDSIKEKNVFFLCTIAWGCGPVHDTISMKLSRLRYSQRPSFQGDDYFEFLRRSTEFYVQHGSLALTSE